MFPLRLSLLLLAGAAIAGLGSVWGAPVAALLIRYLTDLAGLLPHIGTHRPGPDDVPLRRSRSSCSSSGAGWRGRRSIAAVPSGPAREDGSTLLVAAVLRARRACRRRRAPARRRSRSARRPCSPAPSASVDLIRGEQAYFRFVNARGGVNGRQIDFQALDDGGNAANAAANARGLIEQGQGAGAVLGGRQRGEPRGARRRLRRARARRSSRPARRARSVSTRVTTR